MKKNHKGRNLLDKIKKRSLTEQQTKLIEAILDPEVKTIAEAGKIAGYYDRQTAFTTLHSPTVKNALTEIQEKMKQRGVTFDFLASRMFEGLNATKTERISSFGIVKSEHVDVDYFARKEYMKIALQIFRLLQNGKENGGGDQHLHIHLGDKNTHELLGEIKSQLTTLGGKESGIPAGNPDQVRQGS